MLANGSWVTPDPVQTRAYTPWNPSMAKAWLAGLANKPTMIAVDNEIEIASSTHQDMHPEYVQFNDFLALVWLMMSGRPIGYDEELARVLNISIVAKEALPDVLVAAPSTCSWWFCTSTSPMFFVGTYAERHCRLDECDRLRRQRRPLQHRLHPVVPGPDGYSREDLRQTPARLPRPPLLLPAGHERERRRRQGAAPAHDALALGEHYSCSRL